MLQFWHQTLKSLDLIAEIVGTKLGKQRVQVDRDLAATG